MASNPVVTNLACIFSETIFTAFTEMAEQVSFLAKNVARIPLDWLAYLQHWWISWRKAVKSRKIN